ncbi:NmrA family NAD(P)-binding protein [Nocardiopsis potens]|uniref:NmrA family NAD(P)-binding protein n=1 Tax=Nocardiopsis potens TaxID=1246458 RepID=UPI00035FF93B|nr:NmrA family NAD(P)-binding protein [Nocardiopsis potens]
MEETRTILVTGGTGRQGGAVARRLRADGHRVRALVRRPDSPAAADLRAIGAEPVPGDMDDPAGLEAALTGADGVFIVPPAAYGPDGADTGLEFRRGAAVVDAAVAAGVEQAVFTGIGSFSGGAARQAEGKLRIERYLQAAGLSTTVLRPVRFMTNFLGTGAGVDDVRDGVSRHVFPADEPVQLIALEDIAEFAAMAFADPARFAGRTLELAGDDPTPDEAFAAINAATGLDLRYSALDADEAESAGPAVAEARALWLAGHRWHADIEALRALHPDLRTFRTWLTDGGADLLRRALLRA